MKIILGSQSKNRRQVLEEAGYLFEVMVSNVDEAAIRHDDYRLLPLLLARAKAAALLPRIRESALLITADQVVVWQGELREKPRSEEEARRYLKTFSGSPYPAECVNGIVVTNTATGRASEEVEISKVFFENIPPENIEAFLRGGTVFNYAGGFDIRNPLFAPYVRIEGTLESVLGLPMHVVTRMIAQLS